MGKLHHGEEHEPTFDEALQNCLKLNTDSQKESKIYVIVAVDGDTFLFHANGHPTALIQLLDLVATKIAAESQLLTMPINGMPQA